GGKASRLYQELVVKRKASPDVSAWVESGAVCSTFSVEAMVAGGKDPSEIERVIREVLEELGRTGPTDAELTRAKRSTEVSVLSSLQLLNSGGGDGGRAGYLQRLNH